MFKATNRRGAFIASTHDITDQGKEIRKVARVLHFNQITKLLLYLTKAMRYYLKKKKKERFKLKKLRPRQDSNLESSHPKSDALSIRPRGRHSMQRILLLFHNQLYYKYAL